MSYVLRKEPDMKKTCRHFLSLVLAAAMALIMGISVYAASITATQARNIALRNAGLTISKASDVKVKLDGREYDVKFVRKSDKAKLDYDILASNGKILEREIKYAHKKNTSTKKIGADAARQKAAAFSKVSLAKVKAGTCKYERENGEWVYEVEFRNAGREYEVVMLAATGKVIEYTIEYE